MTDTRFGGFFYACGKGMELGNEDGVQAGEDSLEDLAKRRDSIGILLAMYRRQEKLIEELAVKLAETVRQLERLAAGFPSADPDGHRIYHEALIKRIEARTAFWQKLGFELAKYGLFGFAAWAFYALWTAFLKGPK